MAAQAQPPLEGPGWRGGDGPGWGRWMSPHMQQELGMSAEQQAKWKDYIDARRASREQQFQDMEKLREDLDDAILSGDKARTEALSREIVAAHAKMHSARVEDMAYLVSLLSADQVKKLREIRERQREQYRDFAERKGPMRNRCK